STGNFHEKTARIYTDFTLLTSRKEITEEVSQVFDFFEFNYKVKPYKHLIVSPHEMRRKLTRYINQEIENKKQGKPAQIN
ncbi:polyphosphate kinase 1, partial [Ornithobacterium rhinotracheale]